VGEVSDLDLFMRSLVSGPRVKVYCADPSHDDDEECVEVFKRVEFRGELYWLGSLSHSASSGTDQLRMDRGEKPLRIRPDIYHGPPNGPWPSFKRAGGIKEQGLLNGRFNLKCDRCNDTVPARYQNLAPILDTLASNGVPDISLRALAARLSGK
jgi:hypothetical protein